MKKLFTLTLMAMSAIAINAQKSATVTFESASLATDGTLQGTSYTEGGFVFENYYDATYFYNSGYTVSNNNDRSTPGFANQYSVDARRGANNSSNFVIYNPCYYGDCYIRRADNSAFIPKSVALALTTYTSITIQDGDDYAKQFTDNDFYTMTVKGLDAEGKEISSIDIKLVDYPTMWMPWAVADLSELGEVNKILISFSSSDMGTWGMNTPAYIAIDNFTADFTDVIAAPTTTTATTPIYTIDGRQQNTPTPSQVNIVNNTKIMLNN